jgi:hypothetical protein
MTVATAVPTLALGDELSVDAIGFGATAQTPAYGDVNDESLPRGHRTRRRLRAVLPLGRGSLTAVVDVVGAVEAAGRDAGAGGTGLAAVPVRGDASGRGADPRHSGARRAWRRTSGR